MPKITIQEASDLLGVHPDTLRRWETEGKIVPERTTGGHRRYDLAKLLGTAERDGKTICYARVSTRPQKEDLHRQSLVLAGYCEAKGYSYEVINDIGSGINYNKRGLAKLLKLLLSGEVRRLVITNKDRLLRFGAELIFSLCEQLNVEVVILNHDVNSSPEQELVQDVLEVITVFSARLYGLRSHQNKAILEELEKSAKKMVKTCAIQDETTVELRYTEKKVATKEVISLSVVTIQTLVQDAEKTPENKQALDYLDEYGAIFGQATRKGYSERNKIGKTDRKSREIESFICKQLEENYELSSTEARNAYTKSSAAYDSQAELADLYISESFDRIRELRRTIKKLEFKLKKAQDSGQTSTANNLIRKIHYKQQKINKAEAKILRLKESRRQGKFSVTFGSSRLFEKQYRLEENGYTSHEEWLADWRAERSNSSFFVGSKTYQGGNQLVRYDTEKHTLTITVTPSLREKFGKSVTLHSVTFLYGEEWLKAAIEKVLRTSTRIAKKGEVLGSELLQQSTTGVAKPIKKQREQTSRNGSTRPVTYEIVNRNGSVYINATIETPDPAIATSLENGSIGIDFNPGSIDWTLVDKHGNLKRHGSIKTNIQDKRSKQTKDIIGKAVAEIVRRATEYNVPVVIEDLDFAKKKASMPEKSAKYARMLSNMAYSQFIQMIESKCLKSGIELIKIHPAYTSVIGVTKYMAVYGLNSGCAAALVIARRGQGKTEKLPIALASYFRKPEDMLKSSAWAKVAKKIHICGGFNRHKFYSLGIKQVRTNCLLHGKLRQTKASSRCDTVQVKVTPYIGQKHRATS